MSDKQYSGFASDVVTSLAVGLAIGGVLALLTPRISSYVSGVTALSALWPKLFPLVGAIVGALSTLRVHVPSHDAGPHLDSVAVIFSIVGITWLTLLPLAFLIGGFWLVPVGILGALGMGIGLITAMIMNKVIRPQRRIGIVFVGGIAGAIVGLTVGLGLFPIMFMCCT